MKPTSVMYVLSILFVIFTIGYLSCSKSPTATTTSCKTYGCGTNGYCDSLAGLCHCLPGYEGVSCGTVSRQKFLGIWTVFEKGSISTAAQYTTSIESGTNPQDIVIKNFFNLFLNPVNATASGDTIFIPYQSMQGKSIVGFGVGNSDIAHGQFGTITMRYEIIDSVTGTKDDFGYEPADSSKPSIWNK